MRAVALQSDGRILLGGLFSMIDSFNRNSMARLNPDGSVDTFFNPGAGADNTVFAVAEMMSGSVRKVILGGAFNTFNGTSRRNVARLNADGTLDSSFDPRHRRRWDRVCRRPAKGRQSHHRRRFCRRRWTGPECVARLNADGSVDAAFYSGLGPDGPVRALALQSDGKILIGGLFTS